MYVEESLKSEVLELLRQGQKIAAIKRYQEKTHDSLSQAKWVVERLEKSLENDVLQQTAAVVRRDGILAAVKFFRDNTGSSLLESRNVVDELVRDEKLTPRETRQRNDPEFIAELIRRLTTEGLIPAMQFHRQETNDSLMNIKLFLDQLVEKHDLQVPRSMLAQPAIEEMSDDVRGQLVQEIKRSGKIGAIKWLRNNHRFSLADAKKAVEQIMQGS